MKKTRLIISFLLTIIVFLGAGVACGPDDGSDGESIGKESNGKETEQVYNPDKKSPYKTEDVTKENSMWDTEELFKTVPETEKVNVNMGKNLTLFKFTSVGYPRENKDITKVYACVGVPETEMPQGGYPAVVLVHGGAGQIYRDWVKYWNDRGYVAIAYDTYSNGLKTVSGTPQKVKNPDGGPTETYTGSLKDDPTDYKNSWLYHGVANAILCNNLLRARQDVNSTQIGMTGISWGSVITLVTSGIDKRFNAFAPVYGAGYLYDDSFWLAADKQATFGGEGKLNEWIERYDPSSYLPYSTKPTLFVSGVEDNCFAFMNRKKSAGLIKGKAFYSQRNDLGHGHSWNKTEEIYCFFEHVLRGKNSIPIINGAKVENGTITLDAPNATFEGVYLTYTESYDGDSHKWIFAKEEIEKQGDKYAVGLPEKTTAYVVETEYEYEGRTAHFSSPMYVVS